MKSFLILLFCFLSVFYGTSQTYEVISVSLNASVTEWDTDLNTSASEFAPFVQDDVIYFSSDRNPDVLLQGENGWSKTQNLNLFQAKLKSGMTPNGKIGRIGLISEKLVSELHTATASFSVTGDTVFFSQIQEPRKQKKTFPQLYYVVILENKKLSEIKALPFNENKYSFSHPHYHSEEKRLYFVSDRSGGKGGMDIFYSDLEDTGWSNVQPVSEVNTASDELFPFVKDGILFYATYPKGKEDGLDVYWDILDGVPSRTPLEGINEDGKDDLSLFVVDGFKKGVFSSNRNGNDDLFLVDLEKIMTVRNEMVGIFKYKNINGLAAGVTVQVVDEDGFVLYETVTDKNGQFVFREIATDSNYGIKAIAQEELELFILDQKGNETLQMLNDEENLFVYRKIGAQQSGTLSLISDDMIDFELNEGHLTGQIVYENEPNKYPKDLKVLLIDENGNESYSTITDRYGNFDFKKLSMADNYVLQVPNAEDDMVLLIYDLKGNVVAQLKTNADGAFIYKKIRPDFGNELTLKTKEAEEEAFTLNTQTIWGYFEYDNEKDANRKGLVVRAYTEDGELVSEVITDKDGAFRFRNLPPENTYLFQLEENGDNFILDDFTLYVYDRVAQKIAVLKRGQEGFFTFRPLGYDLENELSEIEQENMEFIFSGAQVRDRILVYFDSNQEAVKSADLKVLKNVATVLKKNPSIKVEVNAYADARSSDEYNLILSQKRGNWITAYLIKQGVDPGRLIVNAYGETRLVDQKNDALNRRAEIHLY